MISIEVENLDLDYYIYGMSSRSFKASLLRAATGGRILGKEGTVKVQALQGISFKLNEGDRLGLVGHNGAGKSSLLKVLGSIYMPTRGQIHVSGKSNCLFDVMLGLDSSLNGYENIRLRGLLDGLTRREIDAALPEIVEFCELGDFLKMPLRTYSSGMLLRLGFSIVTHFKTDILLIDEVVNVGDSSFIVKAKKRMQELIDRTKIVVLSTHDVAIIKQFCSHVLCLDQGKVSFFGKIGDYYKD